MCDRVARQSDSIQAIRDDQPVPNGGTIVRWGSVWPANGDVRRSINSVEAVAVAQNKIESRRRLGTLAPLTFFTQDTLPDPTQMPLVIRPGKHHAGRRFFVCKTQRAVNHAIKICRNPWYASVLIDKSREYRVFVCQGRIVTVSERFPVDEHAIAWNLAMGGRLLNVRYKDWPIPVCKTAVLAAEQLGLDWSAIDVMVGTGGNIFVCEANVAPGLRNPFTIQQIARVFTWIDGHDTAPAVCERDRWQNLRHPALQQ